MLPSRRPLKRPSGSKATAVKIAVGAGLAVGVGYLLLSDAADLFRAALAPSRVIYKAGLSEPPTAARLGDELHCLALNIYFEARNEPDIGKVAVGHVVMNRVRDRRFPSTVCGVVRQGGEATRHECQFSWWCDGLSDDPDDAAAWRVSNGFAEAVYWDRIHDPTKGALWYHADYVAPYWKEAYKPVRKLGRHVFYLADKD